MSKRRGEGSPRDSRQDQRPAQRSPLHAQSPQEAFYYVYYC